MSAPQFSVRQASWQEDAAMLRAVREEVFMREQNVTPELEWDGLDAECRHVLALDAAGRAIGCGRLTPDAHIGRMAVLCEWRGRGVGSALLRALLELAHGLPEVALNAQVQALPFYRRFGFVEEGEVFMDADMPHRRMRLRL